jgi:hypothetical protein
MGGQRGQQRTVSVWCRTVISPTHDVFRHNRRFEHLRLARRREAVMVNTTPVPGFRPAAAVLSAQINFQRIGTWSNSMKNDLHGSTATDSCRVALW